MIDRTRPATRPGVTMEETSGAVSLAVVDNRAGVLVVRVEGEIDMATAPAVHEFLTRRLGAVERLLVLDLTGVTFFGSAGLTVLVELSAECEQTDVDLRLVAGQPAVLRPLQVTALDQHFTIVGTVAEAS